jgi:hypothetical protein
MPRPRVAVIVNKWWECDPLMGCLLSDYARPGKFKAFWPRLNDHPRPRRNPQTPGQPTASLPRAIFELSWGSLEVWCVSDLLEHLPDKGQWQSSSQRKAERLPGIGGSSAPALVIAVGTAAAGEGISLNGCVVIGTRCFLHNSKPNGQNPDSNWQQGPFDTLIESAIGREEFAFLTAVESPLRREVGLRLLPTPLAPAPEPTILADYEAVALGNLNVTDYRDYDVTDRATIQAFRTTVPDGLLGSLETTHGLIRALSVDAFIFVSGIVDRLGRFHEDVDPRPYAQNSVGAHNAGLVIAWLIPRLERMLT